ncbi:MAG: hypothetical protein PUE36_02010, partial [Bacteroidales bacterium]|nr:hypothetical protein [Bacteroidales bacterium]
RSQEVLAVVYVRHNGGVSCCKCTKKMQETLHLFGFIIQFIGFFRRLTIITFVKTISIRIVC